MTVLVAMIRSSTSGRRGGSRVELADSRVLHVEIHLDLVPERGGRQGSSLPLDLPDDLAEGRHVRSSLLSANPLTLKRQT